MSTSSELQGYAVQRLFKAMQNDISQVKTTLCLLPIPSLPISLAASVNAPPMGTNNNNNKKTYLKICCPRFLYLLNLFQQPLVQVGSWCCGEYGDQLFVESEEDEALNVS